MKQLKWKARGENMKEIHVPITEEELQELQDGKKFVWVFDNVKVNVYMEEYDEEEEE